ncbi:MAG: transcriptional regulator, LysR family [Firmicutes bacterium]|nr:transcriptional regulator, LysR family [Bacillota bacterium]
MELRRLEYFEAVSRLKSFTKAAEELHVAQPSITASIFKLEEELGILLLQRTKNSVSLTKEGAKFLERAKYILNDVQNVVNEFQDLGLKASRTLKLGIPVSLGAWMFPIIFLEYASKYPEVILEIYELGVQRIIERIRDETIELGFIVLTESFPSCRMLPFAQGSLFVILPKEHPLTIYDKIPFKILQNEQFILCATASYTKQKVMEECEKCNFKPNIIFSPEQVVTVFNMVSSGAGISFVLGDSIAIIKNNPSIALRPLEDAIEFQTGFVWAENRYLSKVSRDFIQFIQDNHHK